MCYFEDCEDRYWSPEDNTPDCPCDCDNSTDTGNTNPGGTGTTNPGGGHICICNCDDCADGTCGTTRYYKPGESFCLYNASHSDLYAWSTNPSNIKVNPDGTVQVIQSSAYICIRSRSNPAFRRCIRVVATNTPPNPNCTNIKICKSNGVVLFDWEYQNWSMVTGQQYLFKYKIYNSTVNTAVRWTSDYPGIAYVTPQGMLKTPGIGQTRIHVYLQANPNISDSILITVKPNYKFFTQRYFHVDTVSIGYWIIKVKAHLLVPEIICSNVCDTSYSGINGGFYAEASDENAAPARNSGVSISWHKTLTDPNDICTYNGDSEETSIARGTLYCYKKDGKYYCGVLKVRTISELKSIVGTEKDYQYIIGGGDLCLGLPLHKWTESFEQEDWSINRFVFTPNILECKRTAIGIKKEADIYYAYLVITSDFNGTTLDNIREFIQNGLKCDIGIFLDGSASTQMRCFSEELNLKEHPGRKLLETPRRKIWNMIKISN